ncbi:DUF2264 domain-containing protein [Lacrimispora indolis]|uniref:DUF2264 domain-containing protein n=1 Tax=Lacrimispora indolis TaxID=69825 RepID=UPI00045E8B49|nr:DUF2264 domain-containing protein [Lacrimispora indolis]
MKLETKKDFQQWMFKVLNPLKPLYSQGRARLSLGDTGVTYQAVSIEMEAFSRPLWALVPLWLGGGRGFEEIYQKGLANGTDPAHPEYWGGFKDYDQKFVEMAAIASGLIFTPEKLWEPLCEEEKKNLAKWLYGINEYIIPDCNWQFFMILVNIALKKLDCRYSEERLSSGLEKIESYYVGEGWYRDGASSQKDYYISFALHYYGLLYAVAMEDEEPERCFRFKERAKRFARDFIYWFDENGSALPYGRSLSYRFGEAAFWSAYVFAGLNDIPAGVVKGILSRHLNWWLEQKIFDRDGVLTIGYGYPNLIMGERYNAPGSPYWGMKTLLCLGLPDDHPFWTAKARELPKLDKVKMLKQADMVMHRHGKDVVAYPAGVCEKYGHGHVPEKYSKFAYSTRFGFSVAKSQIVLHENAPDSSLAFVIDGDDYVFVRKYSDSYEVFPDKVVSNWHPFPGITVTSTIIPKEYGHLRIHEIQSQYDCTAYDCGFSVKKFTSGYEQKAAGNAASISHTDQGCTVSGKGPEAAGRVIEADPNTNVLYPNASIPAVSYRINKGETVRLETKVESFVF